MREVRHKHRMVNNTEGEQLLLALVKQSGLELAFPEERERQKHVVGWMVTASQVTPFLCQRSFLLGGASSVKSLDCQYMSGAKRSTMCRHVTCILEHSSIA